MANKIATEAELARNVRIVVSGTRPFQGSAISTAIGILNQEANRLLKLRKNSAGESPVRGEGEILANVMTLNVTIPLDTRYAQVNEDEFNRAWSSRMRDALGVISGGYVALESAPVRTQVVIETEGTAEDVQKLLGNFGTVLG